MHYKTVVQYSLEILLSKDVFSLLPEPLQVSNLGPNKAHFGSSLLPPSDLERLF
jgi:hypothetical protein